METDRMNPLPPPPRVEFDDQRRLVRSAYFHPESNWPAGCRHWLECHHGNLWLLCPRTYPNRWGTSSFCILTRGPWKGGEEIIQLHFRDSRRPLYLGPAQMNRLPGWKRGQKCWRIHVCTGKPDGTVEPRFWRTVFWRAAPLPCKDPWMGPRPDLGGPLTMTREEEEEFWRWVLEAGSHYANRRPKPFRGEYWILEKLRKGSG